MQKPQNDQSINFFSSNLDKITYYMQILHIHFYEHENKYKNTLMELFCYIYWSVILD